MDKLINYLIENKIFNKKDDINESFTVKDLQKMYPNVTFADKLYSNYPAYGMTFIANRSKVFFEYGDLVPHDVIADKNGLSEFGVRGVTMVRCILYPPKENIYQPLGEWKLFVEGDSFPSWIDLKVIERQGRIELKDWYDKTY